MHNLSPEVFEKIAGGVFMLTGWVPEPRLQVARESSTPSVAPKPWNGTIASAMVDWSALPKLPPSNPWIR